MAAGGRRAAGRRAAGGYGRGGRRASRRRTALGRAEIGDALERRVIGGDAEEFGGAARHWVVQPIARLLPVPQHAHRRWPALHGAVLRVLHDAVPHDELAVGVELGQDVDLALAEVLAAHAR